MSSGSSSDIETTPPDIQKATETVLDGLLPQQSKEKYLVAYNNFMNWKTKKNTRSFSETVFIAYFNELSQKFKPSTLWCQYSMLKCTVNSKHDVNIQNYTKLLTFLKRLSKGFQPKKSKVLTAEQIEKFLSEAPDEKYLVVKVALIFGITGTCRSKELLNITMDDLENHNQMLVVKLRKTKTPRLFTIDGEFYNIVKKYEALRPQNIETNRFFLNYQNETCTRQPIGIHKFSDMPKKIAQFLKLPDANAYTSHGFRRSSASVLANSGGDVSVLRHHGGFKSLLERHKMAQKYLKDSVQNKEEIGGQFTESLNLRSTTGRPVDESSALEINIKSENADDENDISNIELDPLSTDVSRDEDYQGEMPLFAQVKREMHSDDESSSVKVKRRRTIFPNNNTRNQTTEILSRLTAIESSRREMDQRQTAALEAVSAALQRQAAAAERQVDVMIKMVELVEQRVQSDG